VSTEHCSFSTKLGGSKSSVLDGFHLRTYVRSYGGAQPDREPIKLYGEGLDNLDADVRQRFLGGNVVDSFA
jgi:hypothetical protein